MSWKPDFDWILPSLAVGGSFPPERTPELAGQHGIGAVVDLRSEACDAAAVLRAHGIDFLHLPTDDHCDSSELALARGVDFACAQIAAGRRVLIHCQHGIGRSVALALCVMSRLGFEPLDALCRMKDARWLASPSPAQYQRWCSWLEGEGRRAPDFETFAAIAYRHLG